MKNENATAIHVFLKERDVLGHYVMFTLGPKSWDDYELIKGLFVVKKEGRWVYIVSMDSVLYIDLR